MYVCMYVCMYVYMCVCVHVCVYIYIYIYIYTHTHTHTHNIKCYVGQKTNLKQYFWIPSCSVRCAVIPSPYRIQRRFQCFVELSDFISTFDNASPAVPRVLYPFTSKNMSPATFFRRYRFLSVPVN
jgi:hypothetical protein